MNSTAPPERCTLVKVLIADDSSLICDRLAERLAGIPGVEVVGQTADVPATLSAIRDLSPDVVTLDVRMPGGGGFEVLKGMRAKNLKAFVIVLTNYGYSEYEKRAMELGANVFLSKSAEFGTVAELIRGFTQRPAETHLGI